MLGYATELVSRSRESDRAVPLYYIIAWTVGYKVGIGMAIQMLEKSFSNGSNGRNYLQFNMVSQLRTAELDIYSATAADHSSCYSLKSNLRSVLHMCEGPMQSSLM